MNVVLCEVIALLMAVTIGLVKNGDEPKLTYEVHTERSEILQGDDLAVHVKLTNTGDQPVELYWVASPHPVMFRFDIEHVDTGRKIPTARIRPWEWRSSDWGAVPRESFKTLEPSQSFEYSMTLSTKVEKNSQQFFLKRPGTYQVQPELQIRWQRAIALLGGSEDYVPNVWTGTLKAEPFEIIVKSTPDQQMGVQVAGAVTDHDGQPVAAAMVELYQRHSRKGSFGRTFSDVLSDVALTDEAGEYEFADVERAWPYRIVVLTKSAPDGERLIRDDGRLGQKEQRFDIVLKRPVTVRGMVTDDEGRPLSQVRVASRKYTDARGRFSIIYDADTTEYVVHLFRRGYVGSVERTTPEQLNGKVWRLSLYRKESLEVEGQATFVDGAPLADSKIKIDLKPIELADTTKRVRTWEVEAVTDSEGNFKIVLPKPIRYSGIVHAFELEASGGSGRQWECEMTDIRQGITLRPSFDKRGQIQVDIKKGGLPSGFALSISCNQLSSHRLMATLKPGKDESSVVFDDLEPGEYKIYAWVPQLSYKSWSKKVTVPQVEPFRGRVLVTIPEFKMGDVRVKFLMPDGKTVASGMRFYVHNKGKGQGATTDSNGQLRVKDLPAGWVSFEPSRSVKNIARIQISGHKVVAGVETDLGTIRLKSVKEEFGWLEGTLTYDDGTAVPARLTEEDSNGLQEGGYPLRRGAVGQSPGVRIMADGRFRERLPRGKQNVVFEFREQSPHRGDSTKLTVPVDISAGKTTTLPIVLSRRGTRKRVTVKWNDPASPPSDLMAAVEQKQCLWVKRIAIQHLTTAAEFSDLPADGDCVVTARFDRKYFFAKRLPVGDADQSFEIDLADAGSISISVLDKKRGPGKKLGLFLSTEIAGRSNWVCGVNPVTDKSDGPIVPWPNPMIERRTDGTVRITGVGPGKYSLSVTGATIRTVHEVIVESGRETVVLIR